MERDPQLDAFVELLRSATPPPETVAVARAEVMAKAAAPASSATSLFVKLGLLVLLGVFASAGATVTWLMQSQPSESTPFSTTPQVTAHVQRNVRGLDRGAQAPIEVTAEPGTDASRADGSGVNGNALGSDHDETFESRTEVSDAWEPVDMDLTAAMVPDLARRRRPRRRLAGPRWRVPAELATPRRRNRPRALSLRHRRETSLDIEVEEVPIVPGPAAPPSPMMTRALMDVAGGRCRDAAPRLLAVIDGRTGDRMDRVQEAEHWLARCLAQLGLRHAAIAAFDPIARAGARHAYYASSLVPLAGIAYRLPEPTDAVALLEHYELEAIDRLERPVAQTLLWHLARQRHADGDLDGALALLPRVDGQHAVEAHFLAGVAQAQLSRPNQAARSFERVIAQTQPSERLHELAWMNLARLRYEVAMRGRTQRAERLARAVTAWRHIPVGSPRWPQAFHEEMWALYLGGHPELALGHAHALSAPSLRAQGSAETEVVRAMIQLEHCQWDAVEHTLARFHRGTDARASAAAQVVRMAQDPEAAFRLLRAVRVGRSRVPVPIRDAVSEALGDRALGRHLTQVESIDAERRRLGRLRLDPETELRVSADLAILRSLALYRAAEGVQVRLARLRDELRERLMQMDTVEVELSRRRRQELARPNHNAMEPAEGGRIVSSAGGQQWQWDGEWWADELPFYRQTIRNRCGR